MGVLRIEEQGGPTVPDPDGERKLPVALQAASRGLC
jgi:hypothetical protein